MMNKMELIKQVAENTGLRKKEAAAAVDETFSVITSKIMAGEKVQIAGFGSFEVKKRAARSGINPKTKDPVSIPEKKYPSFRAAKLLKESCKEVK